MFNNYAIVQGVDQIVPVDVYVPGCPPGPETLMHGILTLHEQIRTGELLAPPRGSPTGGAAHPARARRRPRRPDPDDRAGRATTMADDTLVKKITRPSRSAVVARRRGRGRGRATVPRRGASIEQPRPAGRLRRPSRCSPTSPTFLRDERAVHDVRRRDRGRPSRSTVSASLRPSTAWRRERYEVVANFLSHVRNRRIRVICEVPGRRPDACRRSPRCTRARTSPSARPTTSSGSSSTVIPISRGSSCPTTGRATRCARTTRRARVPVTFKGDPRPR